MKFYKIMPLIFLILISCSKSETISEGKEVLLNYTLSFDSGEKYESSKETNQPLKFVVGKKMIISGLEEALFGLKKGDKKTIKVSKEKAYGNYKDEYVREYSRTLVPDNYDLKIGKIIMAKKDGKNLAARIKSFNDKVVFIDFNHPLAGKNLIFDVEILEIN